MSYDVYYDLTTDRDTSAPAHAVYAPVAEALEALDLYDCDGHGHWIGGSDTEATCRDLAKISADNPGVLITVHYNGDEDEHMGYLYFRDGLLQHCAVTFVYPPFDPARLEPVGGQVAI